MARLWNPEVAVCVWLNWLLLLSRLSDSYSSQSRGTHRYLYKIQNIEAQVDGTYVMCHEMAMYELRQAVDSSRTLVMSSFHLNEIFKCASA